MAQKRLTRKLTDVIAEVEKQLKAHYGVTEKELDAWRTRAKALSYKFPVSSMIEIEDLWIDYEVQRDVLHKHIINIMKKWDPRICSPGSACRFGGKPPIYLYDAQHRTIAAGILGFTEIPCAVVETEDPNFASYAFEMLNDTGVKRLTPGDLHRNALVRYKNGSRDVKVVHARTMQDQFDAAGIDLQDKGSRASDNLRGDNDYFFSHFKYAQKGIEVDEKGRVLFEILSSIKEAFPLQEEIDQGVYIGLLELHKLSRAETTALPEGWMKTLLNCVKETFKSSSLVHSKAKVQWEHVNPGGTWTAPTAMSNFMRELYIRNGGTKLNLPYHGEGAKMGITDGNVAPGSFPRRTKMENAEKKRRYYEKLALDLNRSLRYHYSAARKSANKRNIGFYITEESIVNLWKKQKGKCALSGIEMTLTHGTSAAMNPTKISVDRIDNSLGYVDGNVQLIIWQANAAKSVWSNQQLIEMCKAVAAHA